MNPVVASGFSRTNRRSLTCLLISLLSASALGVSVAADDPVSSAVRYNREIVRIFQRKCVACHTGGGLSMSLESYQNVRTWAAPIREEILERYMPPWPAATGVRPLANELGLTTREIAIVTAWIDGGAPRGEPSDLPPPTPLAMWRVGKPDLELALPEQTVPSDGKPHVQRVTLATGLNNDRWLRGFDVAPGERRALRSVFLFVKRPDGAERWLGGWTPWYSMTTLPPGAGIRLPAGAALVAELHYQTWEERSQPLADHSRLGLYFQADRPAAPIEELTIEAGPGGAARALRAEAALGNDATIWALRPRLERAGAAAEGSIEIRAIRPDGRVEPLVWVKENRADWQFPYVLREPLRLPRGARIVLSAYASDDAPATATASLLVYPPSATTTTVAHLVSHHLP